MSEERNGNGGVARGAGAIMTGQGATMVVTMVSIIVLSRLLPPSDFGLIAMVGVVTALAGIIRDMGLSVSALKAPELTNQQASNIFWLNALFSAAAAVLVALSGPLLAHIYSEPRLTAITPALSVSFLLGGLSAQFQVQLARSQKFGALAAIGVFSNAGALGIAVAGALLGFGYWALVAQTVSNSLLDFILKAWASRWHPSSPRRNAATKGLVVSGLDLSAASVAYFVSNNAATFMVGVRMGATDVGVYGRALQLSQMPTSLTASLMNVAVPALTRAKALGNHTEEALRKIQSFVGILVAVILVVTSAVAPTLFGLVLGSDWEAAAPVFRILAVGTTALALSQVAYWAFLVEGKSRELLKKDLVIRPLSAVLVVAGSFVSLEATAWGLSTAYIISWLIEAWWLNRTTTLSGRLIVKNGLRLVAISAIAILFGTEFSSLLGPTLLLKLVAAPLVAVVLFTVLFLVTPGGRRELGFAWAQAKMILGR